MFVAIPGIAGLGTTELLIIVLILVILFGAKKLPDLARGSGRAIRIFKSETKGLMDDDDDDDETPPQQLTQNVAPPQQTENGQAANPAQPRPPMHTEN
jgi:sec-independent protein translocase protein TatA